MFFKIGAVVEGGLALDLCVGLRDACVNAKKLPDADGNLPDDYTDLCDLPSSSISVADPGPDPVVSSSSVSVSSIACTDSLPYVDRCDDSEAESFVVKSGTFVINNTADSTTEFAPSSSSSLSSRS